MNLENLPAQMIGLMLGWTFTVFLQIRSNHRAEALKRKDKIVDKLEALSGWLEDEVSKEEFSASRSESSYAGLISQIEVKISQFNQHVGKVVIDGNMVSILRELEIKTKAEDNVDLPYRVRDASWDIIEAIEVCCSDEYFKKQGVISYARDYVHAFYGVIFAVLTLSSLVYFSRFLINFEW